MKSASQKLMLVITVGLAIIITSAILLRQQFSTQRALSEAVSLHNSLEYQMALNKAAQVLLDDPVNDQALWIAGDCARRLKKNEESVKYLRQIADDSEFARKALRLGAEVSARSLYRLSDAVEFHRRILKLDPDDVTSLTAISRLLAVSGQREEAKPFLLHLIQREQASDLLIVLSRETAAIQDESMLRQAILVAPQDPLVLLGLARVEESHENLTEAMRLAREAIRNAPDVVYGYALLGRYLLQQNRLADFERLDGTIPESLRNDPRLLQLRGRQLFESGNPKAALMPLLEAARAIPESSETMYLLAQILNQGGDQSSSNRCLEYVEQTRRLLELHDQLLFSEAGEDPDVVVRLIDLSLLCGRTFEAFGWAQLAISRFPGNRSIEQRHQQLRQEISHATHALVQPAANPVEGIDLTKLSFRDRPLEPSVPSVAATKGTMLSIQFETTAAKDGFEFEFRNGDNLAPSKRMFELTGGGVAAVDFDHDSYTDVLMTQGNDWDRPSASMMDALFRNLRGSAFQLIRASDSDFGRPDFSQGVACGDLDQDGFAEFVTTSTSGMAIWWNLGDGTFRHMELPYNLAQWYTSCAIADLNSDSLPDIYVEGYLQGEELFSRVCHDGSTQHLMCLPSIFDAEPDVLLINSGSGTFRDESNLLPEDNQDGKGLGLLVYSGADRKPLTLIANDTTPNQLLSGSDGQPLTNSGFEAGISLSAQGKAEGSMGIAIGDPDSDGDFDLVITNFLGESHAFYASTSAASYQDVRRSSRLEDLTLKVLGFGTQFLDADNDGVEELFISNGHIDNLEAEGKPWKMPAQLLRWNDGRFSELPANESGDYFQNLHIGRAAARLDWNADGKPDLLLGNLYEPSVILTNTTSNTPGSVTLSLIGRLGARDGTLSTVNAVVEQRQIVRQITAGDGYHCSNEKSIHIGLGQHTGSLTLNIRWASGSDDTIEVQAPSGRWILREGERRLWNVPL